MGPTRPYAKLAYLDIYGLGNLTKVGRIGYRIDQKMFIKIWCQIILHKKSWCNSKDFVFQNYQAQGIKS